jgi:hypothetical protein
MGQNSVTAVADGVTTEIRPLDCGSAGRVASSWPAHTAAGSGASRPSASTTARRSSSSRAQHVHYHVVMVRAAESGQLRPRCCRALYLCVPKISSIALASSCCPCRPAVMTIGAMPWASARPEDTPTIPACSARLETLALTRSALRPDTLAHCSADCIRATRSCAPRAGERQQRGPEGSQRNHALHQTPVPVPAPGPGPAGRCPLRQA